MNETPRRVLIWTFTTACYAAMAWMAVVSGDASSIVAFFAFPLVGAIILTSRAGNGMGRALLFGIGMLNLVMGASTQVALVLGWPGWVLAVGEGLSWPAWMLLPFVVAIFPTGRFQNRFGRVLWWSAVAGGALVALGQTLDPAPLLGSGRPNPLGLALVGAITPVLFPLANLMQVLVYIGILADLVARFVRSRGIARLQFRWLVFAACIIIPIVAAVGVALTIDPGTTIGSTVAPVAAVALNLIPGAILIAVTRHGLFEINRVVSRTVSYALVTLFVGGVYAAIVTSISLLLPDQGTVAVAVATLAAAAAFLPLLRVVRRFVDRRFNRAQYHAEQVVSAFGERLRNGGDPNVAGAELAIAIDVTLQPAAVGIWTPAGTR